MSQDFAIPPLLVRVPVPFEVGDLPVPRFVDAFLADAEDRAEEYGDRPGGGLFVPGDGRYVFQVLQWLLRTDKLARGAAFLEWGSGQGLASIFASLLGLSAVGVELDEELVRESTALAARYDAPARFIHGSYDPATPGVKTVTARHRAAVYVYPWPGEETYFLQLFHATASPGALLLMCLGPEEVRIFRKTG